MDSVGYFNLVGTAEGSGVIKRISTVTNVSFFMFILFELTQLRMFQEELDHTTSDYSFCLVVKPVWAFIKIYIGVDFRQRKKKVCCTQVVELTRNRPGFE